MFSQFGLFNGIPKDLQNSILLRYLQDDAILNLIKTNKENNQLDNENVWNKKLIQTHSYPKSLAALINQLGKSKIIYLRLSWLKKNNPQRYEFVRYFETENLLSFIPLHQYKLTLLQKLKLKLKNDFLAPHKCSLIASACDVNNLELLHDIRTEMEGSVNEFKLMLYPHAIGTNNIVVLNYFNVYKDIGAFKFNGNNFKIFINALYSTIAFNNVRGFEILTLTHFFENNFKKICKHGLRQITNLRNGLPIIRDRLTFSGLARANFIRECLELKKDNLVEIVLQISAAQKDFTTLNYSYENSNIKGSATSYSIPEIQKIVAKDNFDENKLVMLIQFASFLSKYTNHTDPIERALYIRDHEFIKFYLQTHSDFQVNYAHLDLAIQSEGYELAKLFVERLPAGEKNPSKYFQFALQFGDLELYDKIFALHKHLEFKWQPIPSPSLFTGDHFYKVLMMIDTLKKRNVTISESLKNEFAQHLKTELRFDLDLPQPQLIDMFEIKKSFR